MTHLDAYGNTTIAITVVFTAVAATAVGLRLWGRRLKKQKLALNDYAILVALFITVGFGALNFEVVFAGRLGEHLNTVSPSQVIHLNKSFLAAENIWVCANASVKISILHLYITIFQNNRRFRVAVFIVMALALSYCALVILEAFLICHPLAYVWDHSIDGSCGSTAKIYLSAGIINLLIDVMIILLPMPLLWRLHLSLSKKMGLMGIFGIGAAICVITIFRIISIWDLNKHAYDFTYYDAPLFFWSYLEPTLGITSACLPVMMPVISKAMESTTFPRSSGSSRKTPIRSIRSLKPKLRRGDDSLLFSHSDGPGYPLKDIDGPYNEITSQGDMSYTEAKALEAPPRALEADKIQVRSDWSVQSDLSPSAHIGRGVDSRV